MLQLNHIRENKQEVIDRLAVKNMDAAPAIDKILQKDEERRKTQNELDQTLSEANALARDIGDLMKAGKKEDAEAMKAKTGSLKATSKSLSEKLDMLEKEQNDLLVALPNTPHVSVPAGKSAEDNVTVYTWGQMPSMADTAKPHWELAAQHDLIDFDAGNKLTGAGFPVYKGKGARLQRALINFFLDKATEAGYQEIQPPILINEASGFGTGQLPDKEGQMYHVTEDGFYLIPTAEVPVTNLYRDVILQEKDFPVKMTAYTPCFRREAGSYGKDVRGLNRLHQFDKVEIVQLQHPDKSYQTLEEMKEYVSGLLQQLGLHFRILKLCGGDMSFASALTYDFEVYSAAQQRWLEVSSVSNFETFQANRMKLRFKDADKKTRLAHTLNGSALALPRIVAALLENNQHGEGISIPQVLVPYTGFDRI
jgi:seryl-tRNA synthetase